MTSTTTTAPKSTTRAARKAAAGKAASIPTTRRQMEDAVIETMKEAQAVKTAAPKTTARKTTARKTTAKAAPKTTARKTAAPKTPAKAPAKIVTEPLVGTLRTDVDEVNADWAREIPALHAVGGKCAAKFTGQFKDRAWLVDAFDTNKAAGEAGRARSFWFHSCVVSKATVKRVVDLTPAVVEIDLSTEPTAEGIEEEILHEVSPESDGTEPEILHIDHVARVTEMAAPILADEDEDRDPELAEILAEVAAEVAKPKTVRKPRARKTV